MASDEDFWYSVGYTLERLKRNPDGDHPFMAGLADRVRRSSPRRITEKAADLPWPGSERLIAAVVAAAIGPLLATWKPRHATSAVSLLRAGVAGAGAAFLVEVARPLLSREPELPDLDRGTLERVLVGVGDGLVYGAVAEPRLPGPSMVKGVLFGLAEHAVAPLGGLARLAGSLTPQGRIPFVGRFLGGTARPERALVDTLSAAVIMALLYGLDDESRGIAGDRDPA